MIVIALVTGLMTSLIPNLTSNLVEKDTKGIENRNNKTYQTAGTHKNVFSEQYPAARYDQSGQHDRFAPVVKDLQQQIYAHIV